MTAEAGLRDMYERSPYDRRWIYRSACGDTIVDIIWAMANLRSQVDEGWLRDGGEFNIRGERLGVVPPEEMVWNKLYVMQHDRCDWTDVLNLLYSVGAELDWEYLIKRMGDDTPLLAAALWFIDGCAPAAARAVPAPVWESLQCPAAAARSRSRNRLAPQYAARYPSLVRRSGVEIMLIGAMNHPANDVVEEIEWMAAMGLDFLDLTLEPPAAASWRVDGRAIRRALEKHGMPAVGHTAFYLPLASAFESIRCAAVGELRQCLRSFRRSRGEMDEPASRPAYPHA